jgi:hypothetical protein
MTGSRFVPSLLLLVFVFLFSTQALAQDRAKLEKEIDELKEQMKAKAKEFLEPAQEDKTAFAEFLSQPNTGLIRLLPREKYSQKLLTNSGGSFYSFTRLTHEYDQGSDITLEQGNFSVGFAGADFGFFTTLGDVAIESVNLEHPAVQFLAQYTAPSKEPEARVKQQERWTGIQANNFTYKGRVFAKVNTTYVLRSISFERSDVLVALRMVRLDSDDSITLLWKLLKKSPTPRLERP